MLIGMVMTKETTGSVNSFLWLEKIWELQCLNFAGYIFYGAFLIVTLNKWTECRHDTEIQRAQL